MRFAFIHIVLQDVPRMYTVQSGNRVFVARESIIMCVFTLWSAYFVAFSLAKAISGQVAKCSNEGEHVFVPLVAADPCYKCYCRRSRVECETSACPSLEGCHAILFSRPRGHCCDVCRGCTVDGTEMASGDVLLSDEDPCIIKTCQAGVVTTSREICSPPCHNPVQVPGQCCPSCSGCYFNDEEHMSGETFTLNNDNSVQCVCKGGNVTCSKRACPVLNCPEEKVYYDRGEKCPKCKGHRMVFDTPKSCFFSKRVFANGDVHILDSCTSCVCVRGTMVCDRQQCAEIACLPKDQITVPGTCCPMCKKKLSCSIGDVTMKHEETWETDKCTTCTCRDGQVRCDPKKCSHADSDCQKGYTITYPEDKCCPVCTKNDGVCTIRGLKSNKIETFDGRTYTVDGFCTHDLVRDCGQGHLTVKAKYKTKGELGNQIDIVTIRFGSTRIKLYRTSEIRINRTSLFSNQFASNDFSLKIRPSRITVKVNLGLSVSWNLNGRLSVKVSGDFFQGGRLCGLCGNFDGDVKNDLLNRKGGRVEDSSLMTKIWVRGKLCRQNPVETDGNVTIPGGDHFAHRGHHKNRVHGRKNHTERFNITHTMLNEIDNIDDTDRSKLNKNDSLMREVEHSDLIWKYNISGSSYIFEDGGDASTRNMSEANDMLARMEKGKYNIKDKVTGDENLTYQVKNSKEEMAETSRKCEEHSLQWTEAWDSCQKIRNLKLEHCGDVIEVVSFMRSCTEDVCTCWNDKTCEEKYLTSYLLPCIVTPEEIYISKKRTIHSTSSKTQRGTT